MNIWMFKKSDNFFLNIKWIGLIEIFKNNNYNKLLLKCKKVKI